MNVVINEREFHNMCTLVCLNKYEIASLLKQLPVSVRRVKTC